MSESVVSLIFSGFAVAISMLAFYQSYRTKQSDRFAKLYEEFNSANFGAELECVGEWCSQVASKLAKEQNELSEEVVREEYRRYLDALRPERKNTKVEPLEKARRSVKAYFIKCLLYYEGKDISRNQFKALVTRDKAMLMLCVMHMTRAQTDWWKFPEQPQDLSSRNSSDEPYFARWENHLRKGFFD